MRSLGVVMLWLACTPAPGGNACELSTSAAEANACDSATVVVDTGSNAGVPVGDGTGSGGAAPAALTAGSGAAVTVTVSAVPRWAAPAERVTVAAHDAEIAVLAATEDGVVVSADRRGAVRRRRVGDRERR